MFKGSNRRMFRRPGSARKAAGILASSRELMNQVEPIRLDSGGFVEQYEKMLIDQMQRKPRGNILTDLGLATAQAALQNPELGTTESIVAGLTQAIPMQTKRQETEDARKRALLEGRLKLETYKSEEEKRAREDEKAKAAIFGAQYTDATLNALARAGYRPDIENNGFIKGGKTFSIDEILSPDSATFDKDAFEKYQESIRPKLTEGQAMMDVLLGEGSTYDEMLTAGGLLASRLDNDLQEQELKNYKGLAAERFAEKVQAEKQKDEKYKNSSFDIIQIDPTLISMKRESDIAFNRTTPGLADMITTNDFALLEIETVADNGDITTEYLSPQGELVTTVVTRAADVLADKTKTQKDVQSEHNEKTTALFRTKDKSVNSYR